MWKGERTSATPLPAVLPPPQPLPRGCQRPSYTALSCLVLSTGSHKRAALSLPCCFPCCMHCALGSYECEVLGGMRELLASGAIASMKLEVFDVLLKLQGCSALQLQRLVSQAGFTLYRISEDATSIPDRSAVVSPETVPSLSQGVPYNLWCVRHSPPSSPEASPGTSPGGSAGSAGSDATRLAKDVAASEPPPSPPTGGGGSVEISGGGSTASAEVAAEPSLSGGVADERPVEWRRRRNFTRKLRTTRRLEEEARRQLERERRAP